MFGAAMVLLFLIICGVVFVIAFLAYVLTPLANESGRHRAGLTMKWSAGLGGGVVILGLVLAAISMAG